MLMVTCHISKAKTIVRMLKIKKENERSFAAVLSDLEN